MLLDDIDPRLRLRFWRLKDEGLLGLLECGFGGSAFTETGLEAGLEAGLEDIGKYLCFSSSK